MAGDVYARVGAVVRARREAAGMTQAALATRSAMSRSSVTNIERGGQAILLHQLLDLARALRTDPCDIVRAASAATAEPAARDAGPDPRMTELLGRLGPAKRSRR